MIRADHVLAVLLLLSSPLSAIAQTPPAPATPEQTQSAPGPAPAPAAPAPATPAPATPTTGAPAIEDGSTVQLEYTLSDDAGAVIDTNKGGAPLTYTHGERQIIPGLEKQLSGMHAGEQKHVVLKPEDGYGPVNPSAETEVPKDMLPPDSLTVGAHLMARNAQGEGRPVTIKEIKETTVVLDLNHPLAGKTLVFDIKVLDVAPPKTGGPKSTN